MSQDPTHPAKDADLSGVGRALLATSAGSHPPGPWVPPTAEELGKLLLDYEIVKMLGRGGMGAVYMARQRSLDRPVAIKILSTTLEDADPSFAERFKNEARAMGKLNHPGIVSVYDFGETKDGLLYIVMEFVEGTDVARMIAKAGRLHTEHAMAITAHVCDALAYAHERGIIHRDIKPANIMVSYDGAVKVADFGLAKVNVGGNTLGLTQSGMAMGTLHYMAPEALMLGSAVDHRADIYAVGVMLYQMLSGKVPHGMFQMPSFTVAGLDPRYDRIIQKAMMEDRETRYQSARELRSDLDGILTQPVVRLEAEAAQPAALPTQARPQRPGGQQPQPYRPPQAQARSVPPPPRKSSLVWLWVAVLVISAAAGWIYLDRQKHAGGAAQAQTSATGDASKKTEIAEGWEPLFPSDSLAGWTGDTTSYRVANGVLTANAEAGNLISPRTYQSFSLRFDLKLGAGADTGISFWEDQFTGNKTQAARAYEVQLKDHSMQPAQADSRLSHGSLLFWQAAEAQTMGPLGSWNEHEIRVIGTQATVIVNGTKVVDVDLRKLQPKTDGRPLELSKGTGHIGILGRSGPVEFRNMRIKSHATAPPPPTDHHLTIDDAFMKAHVLGTTWEARYSNDSRHDTLEFKSTGNAVVKTASMGGQQQAVWSIEDGGRLLKITTLDRSGFYFSAGFLSTSEASVEFFKVPPAKMVGTLTKRSGGPATMPSYASNTSKSSPTQPPPEPILADTGWQTLFNGRDLTGWRVIGNTQGFTVDQGSIKTEGGRADLIYTGSGAAPASFREFELRMKVKTGDKGNSGLWFHLPTDIQSTRDSDQSLQVQIDNGFDKQRTGSIVHVLPLDSSPVADGTWFELRVLAQNNTVTAFVDGRQVNQWTQPEKWQPPAKAALARMGRGAIGLESWRGNVWFRDIQLRVLDPSRSVTIPVKGTEAMTTDTAGWQPLFPTDSLAGWKGDVAGYRLDNGILTSTAKGGDLISPREYGNFHLKFDLRVSSGGNNGIGIWCADNAQGYKFVGHTGFEIQLIDDASPTYTKGDSWHLHGALAYFVTPKAKPMGPAGTWNAHEIRMEGTRLTVIINNVAVIDQELPTGDPEAKGSRRHRLDLSKKRGHIVFCGMKGPVDFRNVMIKDLDAPRPATAEANVPVPTVAASATTWIDNTGRVIQARFISLSGDNLVLELNRKNYPLSLSTLSAASQQIARDLQSQAARQVNPAAPENALLGLWHQHNDGKALPFHPLAFFADGSAGFAWLGRGMGIDGRWQLVDDEVRVFWPNGCVYHIDLKKGTPTKRFGKGIGTPDFTMEITHTGLRPAAAMPAADDLAGLSFDFSFKDDHRSGSNGVLRLQKDGTVVQQSPMDITGWKVANGFLMLMDSRHECRTLFNHFERKNGRWSIRGQYVPDAAVEHQLEQR